MSESNERGGFSFQLSETPPPTRSEEQAPLGDLVLDLQDFGTWEEPEEVPKLRVAEAKPRAPEEAPKPRIKKIQFPVKKAANAREPRRTELTSSEPKPSDKPKTRFSDSISAPAVAARLLDEGDSEPPPRMNRSEFDGDLALPDDLPSFDQMENHPADDTWGSETPSAQEIWNNARRTWKATAKKAAALGEMSLRAGQKAAHNLNTKIKENRESSTKEREARAALEATSQKSAAAMEEDVPSEVRRPSPVTSLSKTSLKKLAAPLSAVAAAGLVYFVGTQLLGSKDVVSLSSATHAPPIPELGSLEGEGAPEKPAPPDRDRRSAAAEKSDPESEPQAAGPMKVEVAPMPDGLSWPGKGLIEVVTSEEELIYVDGVFTGRGPLRRIPVSPGEHEVSIRTGGNKRSGTVQVETNKNTRAIFSGE